MYRGLVRNGSSGFSTKKVEFPASLLRSERDYSTVPSNFVYVEGMPKSKKPQSLTRSLGNSTKKGRMQLKTRAKNKNFLGELPPIRARGNPTFLGGQIPMLKQTNDLHTAVLYLTLRTLVWLSAAQL
jgi:hypothetical protein